MTELVDFVETIRVEPEFKELCDGLLRQEVGPLVQLFAGKGADGGVDAEYSGMFDGTNGRWVFQYKFVHPQTDPNHARSRLKKMFMPSPKGRRLSEFAKPRVQGICGYILLTNVAMTVSVADGIRSSFRELHPDARFCIWDSASLNAMLRTYPQLARSRSYEMEQVCLRDVIQPVWEWCNDALAIVSSWTQQEKKSLWPWKFTHQTRLSPKMDVVSSAEVSYVPTLVWPGLPWAEDDRVFVYASRLAFPNALKETGRLQDSFVGLAKTTANEIEQLAARLKDSSGPLQTLPDEARESIALGAAFYLLDSSWGYCSYIMPVNKNRVQIGSRILYEGEFAGLAKEPLDQLLAELRARYQMGDLLPKVVAKARASFAEALVMNIDRLWHPVNIGMDSPAYETE